MGKNSFLWSLRFVDKGKRACIVKYVKSVMIKKVKYFTQTVDKVPDKSPGFSYASAVSYTHLA